MDDYLVAVRLAHHLDRLVNLAERKAVGDDLFRIDQAPTRSGGWPFAWPAAWCRSWRPCGLRGSESARRRARTFSWVVMPNTFHLVPRRRRSTISFTAAMGPAASTTRSGPVGQDLVNPLLGVLAGIDGVRGAQLQGLLAGVWAGIDGDQPAARPPPGRP